MWSSLWTPLHDIRQHLPCDEGTNHRIEAIDSTEHDGNGDRIVGTVARNACRRQYIDRRRSFELTECRIVRTRRIKCLQCAVFIYLFE